MSCKARYPDLTDCTLFPSRGSAVEPSGLNQMQNISLLTDSDLCLLFLFKMKTLRQIQIKHSLKYFQSDWKISELKLRLVCPARQARLPRYLHIHHQFSLVVGVCKHGYCGGGMASLYSIKTSDERISNIMKYWGGLAVY